jgi:hypothetical protein
VAALGTSILKERFMETARRLLRTGWRARGVTAAALMLGAVGPLVLSLAGCHAPSGVGYPAHYITAEAPMRVWVTETNDSVVIVNGPKMRGDTLTGFIDGRYRELPASEVKFVKAMLPSHWRTAAVASVAALGVGVIFVAITDVKKSGSTTCYDERNDVVPC